MAGICSNICTFMLGFRFSIVYHRSEIVVLSALEMLIPLLSLMK